MCVNHSLYLFRVYGCCIVIHNNDHFPILFVMMLLVDCVLLVEWKYTAILFYLWFRLKFSCFIMPLIIKGWKNVTGSISAQVLRHERVLSLLYKRLLCDPFYKVLQAFTHSPKQNENENVFFTSFLQNLSLLNPLPIISIVQPLKVWKRDRAWHGQRHTLAHLANH